MPDATHHLTLANGLQLTLRHAPRLKRAAAAIRVQAGSHDAPAKWPGLAHFLEHLFFLGTDRFPLENGLMRYVQGLGGQVNASTRERTTDFFFEVPPDALAGGLERLCQMLAEPDLSIERQRREREVIHAEFIAWSRNPEAQRTFTLLQSVSPCHPLSGFHAGNRYTLAIEASAFQLALRQFHQRFYHAGQMVLSLCGPKSLDELRALGMRFGALLATGEAVPQAIPPALLHGPLPDPTSDNGRLELLFSHEQLPCDAAQALELLLTCLGDNRPGGWLAHLRQRGWLHSFKAEPLYAHAGQLLWSIHLQLSADASVAEVQASLNGWLGFLKQADHSVLNHEFARLQHSRAQAANALELARRDSAGMPLRHLDEPGLKALKALLSSLPSSDHGHWWLPPAEPLLLGSLPTPMGKPLPANLAISNCLPASRQFAAIYLRWWITAPWSQRLQPLLEHTLRPLVERAERASVQLSFSAIGDSWQVRCAGLPEAVIRTLDEALAQLRSPAVDNWQSPPAPEPSLIPLRALLKALPDALRGFETQAPANNVLDQGLLDRLWQTARWQALAVGFGTAERSALGHVMQGLMGTPAHVRALGPFSGRHWHRINTPGGENALLLFCPLPAQLQAAGRLLAHLVQGPYYQRLRVELQLGYAVFSAFRQVEGIGGLLFGVQSPQASHAQILGHLQHLLEQDLALAPEARQALADQLEESAMNNADVAEWAWQAHLAAQADDLAALRRSILMTGQTHLDQLRQHLLATEHGWLCLANAPVPDARWQ